MSPKLDAHRRRVLEALYRREGLSIQTTLPQDECVHCHDTGWIMVERGDGSMGAFECDF